MKFYLEFLIEFENVKVCYGVGYELVIVDVSWVFLVVFWRIDISVYRYEWYE